MNNTLIKTLIKTLTFIVAFMLSGCAGALESQDPEGGDLLQSVTPVDHQPSPKIEMIYRILVAEVAGKRGFLDVALANYRAVALASDDPRVSERAVGIALFMNDNVATLEIAQRWYSLVADSQQARQTLVLALLRNDRVDEAVEHLDGLRAQLSDDGQQGFVGIGLLLAQIEDKPQVFQVMEQLLSRHPESPYALYYHALGAVGVDAHEQALESLNSALSYQPDWSQAHLLRSQVMMAMGDIDGAVEGLAQALEAQPEDLTLRMGYARLLVGADRFADAEQQYHILIEKNPRNDEALYALGILSAESKKFDEAVVYFMRVLRLGKRLMNVYYELGRVEEQRDDYQAARDWYARVTRGERYLNAQVRIGAMLVRMGDLEAMSSHMEVLRRNNSENRSDLHIAEAEILREEGYYQQAFELLDQSLEQYPDDKELRYARALAAEKVDRLEVLEHDLRVLIEDDPDNGHALNALGYTLADRTDRYQEALGYLERAIALLPEDAAVLDSMGWVKYRLGNHEVSLDYLRRAYSLHSDSEIAAHLSEVLWVTGQHEEAKAIWEEAIERDPDSEFLFKVKDQLGL